MTVPEPVPGEIPEPDSSRDDVEAQTGEQWRWTRQDFMLLRKANRQKWGVPDHVRNEALFQASKMIFDPHCDKKTKLIAAQFMAEMDRLDMGSERLDIEKEKLELDKARFEHEMQPKAIASDDYVFDITIKSNAEALASGADGPAAPILE